MNAAAVDAVAAGKLAERCPLPAVITADLLKHDCILSATFASGSLEP